MYKVLETGGQLTQKDLVRETSLPPRTVRYALRRLKEERVLVERFHFSDARQSLYGLDIPGEMDAPAGYVAQQIPGAGARVP